MTRRSESAAHASAELLERYAGGGDLAPDVVWALESHLEGCPGCRAGLATAVHRESPDVLERVRVELDADVARSPQALRRSWWAPATRWAPPSLVPWLAMTVGAVVTAVGFDVVTADLGDSRVPSVLLLLAPIAPLLGVAAAWTRGRDPVYELVAATPRAGLELVLRRTLAVLAVVMPVLALGGLIVGESPVRWLLPCLAFTLGGLALGAVIGVTRAATGLGTVWAVVVVAPSLATEELPLVLEPASMPGWAALSAVIAVVLVVRRQSLTRLPSGR